MQISLIFSVEIVWKPSRLPTSFTLKESDIHGVAVDYIANSEYETLVCFIFMIRFELEII